MTQPKDIKALLTRAGATKRKTQKHSSKKSPKTTRPFWRYPMYLLNGLVALLYLLALVAQVLSPRYVAFPQFLALSFPVWVVANIFFVIYWIPKRSKAILCSAILLIISLPTIRDTFNLFPTKEPLVIGVHKSVKVMTFNVSTINKKEKLNEIIALIKAENPDIITLQEFGFIFDQQSIDKEVVINAFKDIFPYSHIWYKNQTKTRWWGNATFSKYPIIGKQKVETESRYNVSIASDIVINNDTIRFINNHLESFKFNNTDKNELAKVTHNIDKEKVAHFTEHFRTKMGIAYRIRALQAKDLQRFINESPLPTIICGDFNDVPQSYTYRTIKGRKHKDTARASWGYHRTLADRWMWVRIDYILVPESSTLHSYEVKHSKISDHYPVVSVFSLP